MALSHVIPGLLLLAIALAQGLFVSGILPIIERSAPEQAPWIYALYFAGLLTGQVLIVKFRVLAASRLAYPGYVALFGLSIVLMGVGVAVSPASLIVGRGLEGLAAGLALPVGFSLIVGLRAFGDMGRRISLFNSLFALGFVAGPPLVAAMLGGWSASGILTAAGFAFVALAALVALGLGQPPAPPEAPAGAAAVGWFDGFYGLFLAKCFYGFFLPFMAAHLITALRPFTIGQVMVAFAVLFVVGQAIAAHVARRFPADHLRVYLPLALSLTLVAVYLGPFPWLMTVAALFHSWLLFLGYLGAAAKPTSAQAFARLNAMSDPGMLLGAFLAGFGPAGMLAVAALGVVPVVRAWRAPSNRMRAEHYHPFVGPIGVRHVLRKHADPLETARDWPAESFDALRYDYRAEQAGSGPTLTLAFGGDWAPTPEPVSLSPALRGYLLGHDLRVVNLEGGRTAARYERRMGGYSFDIPASHFDRMIWGEAAPGTVVPAFNVLACINNHTLDGGAKALDATLANVRAAGLAAVSSELEVIAVEGVKVGFFACAFGSNMLWRRHPALRVVKPEQLVHDARVREALLSDIRRYKAQVDVLVMSYHWGYESECWPAEVQRACWLLLREAGVDILHGHHSHIVQPFEVAPDGAGLCLYSCGNFAMAMPLPVYREGAVFSVRLGFRGDRWIVERVETRFTGRQDGVIDLIPSAEADACRRLAASRPERHPSGV